MDIALSRSYTNGGSGAQNGRLHGSNSSLSLSQHTHSDHHTSVSSRPSRSSDSTNVTSSSTAVPNGPVANDNIINRVADKETSLFQKCVMLQQRLACIPGLDDDLQAMEEEMGEERDPVKLLWETLRCGYPLLTLFNALEPDEPIWVDEDKVSEAKRPKAAAAKFQKACITQLKFSTEECFTITDLWGADTTGFVKVVKVVSRICDMLLDRGLINPNDNAAVGSQPTGKRTHRQHVINEIVVTERTYVQHLELLQDYSNFIVQKGIIPGDAVHQIFLNLNALLDFQQRFLIKVEAMNHQPEESQNWGKLFQEQAAGFSVYEPCIQNQRRCEEMVTLHFDRLRSAGGPVEFRQMIESPAVLSSFLLKPFQRLAKYPLLLRELRDKGDLDEEREEDLTNAISSINAVLERSNASVAREERQQAVEELKTQVEDWKQHQVEKFGELQLYGTYNVIKGDPAKDAVREDQYRMYLFEKILLCCKDANPNKPKNKMMNKAQALDRKGKPKLQLKGRIFMQNVTETRINLKPGNFTCQIYWRGDETIESFVIRFPKEETLRQWDAQINENRRKSTQSMSMSIGTSDTRLMSLDQHDLTSENPYQEDDFDDDEIGTNYGVRSLNGSDISLPRSRSGTSGSNAAYHGSLPPGAVKGGSNVPLQFMGKSLTLRTARTHDRDGYPLISPPEERSGSSYFSPTAESPQSAHDSRSSSMSGGMFPFPRQGTPHSQSQQDHRYTAPAAARSAGRESSGSWSSRNAQARNRSGSSPDGAGRRKGSNPGVGAPPLPPVPSVPHHLAHPASISRSQDASPVLSNGYGSGPRSPTTATAPAYSPGAFDAGNEYDGGFPVRRDSRAANDILSMPLHSGGNGLASPPLGSPDGAPSQIKVRVKVPAEGSTMTLVVAFNISYQSLKDRIDAKLQRYSSVSLQSGQVKLKYLSDDDFITIQNDEDVMTAFETWQEQMNEGPLGEVELYVHPGQAR